MPRQMGNIGIKKVFQGVQSEFSKKKIKKGPKTIVMISMDDGIHLESKKCFVPVNLNSYEENSNLYS